MVKVGSDSGSELLKNRKRVKQNLHESGGQRQRITAEIVGGGSGNNWEGTERSRGPGRVDAR